MDVRIVAATNRDLAQEVKAGRFREDLYFRIDHRLTLPPLRERPEDLFLLAHHFYRTAASGRPAPACEFNLDLAIGMALNRWPGNVRELRLALKGMALHEPPFGPEHLPPDSGIQSGGYQGELSHGEIEQAEHLLAQGTGQRALAKILGRDRSTMIRQLDDAGVAHRWAKRRIRGRPKGT